MKRWTEDNVLDEIATLWQLDTDRQGEGWTIAVQPHDDDLMLVSDDGDTFIVTVERVEK